MGLRSIIKEVLQSCGPVYRAGRLILMRYRSHVTDDPVWDRVLRNEKDVWNSARRKAGESGPKILLATGIGLERAATRLESLLGVALTMRGAEVHVLLCDAVLPACQACTVHMYPRLKQFLTHGPAGDLCVGCGTQGENVYKKLGFTVHRYSDLLTDGDRTAARVAAREVPLEEIGDYRLEGLAVGEHATAGALRFFARATFDGEPEAEAVVRRYFEASLLTALAALRLFRKTKILCAVMLHGIYVPQGVVVEAAKKEGVRVAIWNVAYRKKHFIFSHQETYHHTLISEPVAKWEQIPWTPEREKLLTDYLRSRWQGTEDWIWFQDREPVFDRERIMSELGLDPGKPVIVMLTNVLWDAQLHYPANAFENQMEWIRETIAYFAERPDLQLVLRIHPAEISGSNKSRQLVAEEVGRLFPNLPDHIFVVRPDSKLSTYSLVSLCDTAIIYGTKTGVEITSMGIPVIVAGEAWIRNKGITTDVSDLTDYRRALDSLPGKSRLADAVVRRARMYAYHYFFRRMIPIEATEPISGWPPYRLSVGNLSNLLPGNSVGLDVICRGILEGNDFIYHAERE